MKSISASIAVCTCALLLAACGDDKKETKAPAPKAIQKEEKTVSQKTEQAPQEIVKSTPVVEKPAELLPGDIARGEKAFKKCKSCHDAKADGKHKVGPNLFGIIGRKAGKADGFTKYSKSITEIDLVWDEASIEEYVANPTAFLKEKTGNSKAKSKMTFKLKKKQAAKDVSAYLASLK